jgi:hypothetical protein
MPKQKTNSSASISEANTPILAVNLHYARRAYARYLTKLSSDDVNGKGCHIAKKAPRRDGYVRWSITKGSTKAAFGEVMGEKTFYLHHLAWYATGYQMPRPKIEHLSHLCGDSRCFNPKHLCIESPTANNSRKNCAVVAQCPCPCKVTFCICKHIPKCIASTLSTPKNQEHES